MFDPNRTFFSGINKKASEQKVNLLHKEVYIIKGRYPDIGCVSLSDNVYEVQNKIKQLMQVQPDEQLV